MAEDPTAETQSNPGYIDTEGNPVGCSSCGGNELLVTRTLNCHHGAHLLGDGTWWIGYQDGDIDHEGNGDDVLVCETCGARHELPTNFTTG